jgi:hypothetical protein
MPGVGFLGLQATRYQEGLWIQKSQITQNWLK